MHWVSHKTGQTGDVQPQHSDGAQTALHACTGHADTTVHKHMHCMRQHSKSVSGERSQHHGQAGVVSNVWWLSHLDARPKPNHGELSTQGCVCII